MEHIPRDHAWGWRVGWFQPPNFKTTQLRRYEIGQFSFKQTKKCPA